MSKSALITRNWVGGASVDPKVGTENSFKRSLCIDNRKRMSSIRLQKKTVKESGSIVDTAVYDGVRVPDHKVFFMGDTKVYLRTPEAAGAYGAWSVKQSGLTNVKSGMYNRDRNKVYMPGDKTVHAINRNAGDAWQGDLINQLLDYRVTNTGTNAYTIPSALTEADKLTWQPEIEPLIRMGFYVITKGTGDMVITVHDAANTVIATATLTNANITAGQMNYFTFSSQIRMQAKPNPQTYHVHVHVPSGTASTLRVATAATFSTADVETYADCLISGVYHPCGEFLQFVIIGNGNYVAVWEPITDAPLKTEFDPHRLKLPSEYNVIGFTELGEDYVFSAYRSVSSDYGSDFGANSTEGLLAIWDGASKGFRKLVKIEGGAMESIFTYQGLVYGYINGVLHVTAGDIPVPLMPMPGVDNFTSSHGHDDDVYLQAPYKGMCVRNNMLQMAFPMSSCNDSIIPGACSFGKKTKDYAESFVQDHIPSHGDTAIGYDGSTPAQPLSGVTYIGRFGKNMFLAWKRGSSGVQTFGVDVIRENNPCYDTGSLDYLDIDNKLTYKLKDATEIIATYEGTLPEDADIKLRYRLDGETDYQYGEGTEHREEEKQFVLKVNKSYYSIEYGIELYAGNGVSPVVTSTTAVIDKRNEGL